MYRSIALGLALLGASSVYAAEPTSVLILGTYHFHNPGLDLVKTKVDDVLAPQRQKEIQAVVDALAAFKPNQIAVEANTDELANYALPDYHDYLTNKSKVSRNEISQIGYRLAKQLGHRDVIGIDVDGDFPFEKLQEFANATGQGADLQSMLDQGAVRAKDFELRQQTSSIGQLLRGMNDPVNISADHGWYMSTLRFGRAAQQPGAHLLSSWAARNSEICARLVQRTKPGERVLVLYGAGHSHLLRQCVQEMPDWKLVEANDFLPK